MVPSLNAIHEFMAQKNIAIISDNSNSGNYSFALRDRLITCGYNTRHIRPWMNDFDDDGRCLCVEKLSPVFSALIVDLLPAAASIIISEAITKGIKHIWLLPRAYNDILREKGTDNNLNLIYNNNILSYLRIPKTIQRSYLDYIKFAFSAFDKR